MSLPFDDQDPETTPHLRRPQSFRERHALSLLGAIMVALFTLVVVVQVGC
jgi:hypothetical protein